MEASAFASASRIASQNLRSLAINPFCLVSLCLMSPGCTSFCFASFCFVAVVISTLRSKDRRCDRTSGPIRSDLTRPSRRIESETALIDDLPNLFDLCDVLARSGEAGPHRVHGEVSRAPRGRALDMGVPVFGAAAE